MTSLRNNYKAVSESHTVNRPSISSLQKFFQIENGIPIHLKAGRRDGLLLTGIFFMCGIGLLYTGYNVYELALGRIKKKE